MMSFKSQFRQCLSAWASVIESSLQITTVVGVVLSVIFALGVFSGPHPNEMELNLHTIIETMTQGFHVLVALLVFAGYIAAFLCTVYLIPPALCALWKICVVRKRDEHIV